jgi:hypothetical protein
MYRTADSIWVVRYRFTPCCYRQELQQCRDLNTRMLSLPNPIDAFPLACMYADTAAKQRVDEQQADWGDWGVTRRTLG